MQIENSRYSIRERRLRLLCHSVGHFPRSYIQMIMSFNGHEIQNRSALGMQNERHLEPYSLLHFCLLQGHWEMKLMGMRSHQELLRQRRTNQLCWIRNHEHNTASHFAHSLINCTWRHYCNGNHKTNCRHQNSQPKRAYPLSILVIKALLKIHW